MATRAIPERMLWAIDLLDPGPQEHLLEIGCGPGVAVSLVGERLDGGRIVAIDRSATATARARKRNAEHIAAGRAVVRTVALEALNPSEVLGPGQRFDKVFAMNVNLFWVRSPARELDLVKRLLAPGGGLYLFYGYGDPGQSGKAAENTARIPGVLAEYLTAGGFSAEFRTGGPGLCAVATPDQARQSGGR